jgi:hypothetical protein
MRVLATCACNIYPAIAVVCRYKYSVNSHATLVLVRPGIQDELRKLSLANSPRSFTIHIVCPL